MENDGTAKWMQKELHRGGRNKGTYVRIAAEDVDRKKKQERRNSGTERIIREDGEIRREIQLFITSKVEQGFPPDQLYKRLCFIFGKSKYQPYKQYFKTWIMNAVEKQISGKEIEEEEKGE